ncbi:MAG TPA: phosphatase PAP2 family protein [Rhodocyclaceae bacterium]
MDRFATMPWHRQWVARVRVDFWLKGVGITAFIWGFFVAYFWLLRNPFFPVAVMPTTPPDDWISFAPASLGLYLTLWVYVTFPPSLIVDRAQLVRYGIAAALLCGTGLLIFLFWPSAVPAGLVSEAEQLSAGFALLKGIDAAGNAFPSLHVATAVFSAFWLDRLLRQMNAGVLVRGINVAWCCGIVYSTLATKQHVFLDALSGTILGIVAAWLSLAWISARPPGIR